MIGMSVILNGDGAWPDLPTGDKLISMELGDLAVLNKGTTSGKPSVAFRLDLPDGRTVVAQTTARLLVSAARMIEAKYPDLMA